MKGLRNILIFTITSILTLSCSAGENYYSPAGDKDYGRPFMTGKVTDVNGIPIEHIMVTIDWGSEHITPDIEYTDSDGRFIFRSRFTGSNESPATVIVRLEDIDGDANGGLFESKTESMTIFRDDIYSDNGNNAIITFRLNRATASENNPLS